MRMIGKSDGSTAVTVIKRNSKLTWKQKLEKCKYKIKRAYVEHTIKAKGHSLDEVIDYIVNVFGFQVQIDEVATREWYEKANEWNCECEDCRHFIDLAKKKELPIPVMEILEQFGIVPEKATYVCEMITEEHKVL